MQDRSHNVALAADGKAPDAFRTIGEVSRALGIPSHVLRYWEEQFPTLSPVKRAGGRRLYRPADVELIATIDGLVHQQGYTLRGARQFLEGQPLDGSSMEGRGAGATAPLPTPPGDHALLTDLKALRQRLATALAG